jgi:chromosomal replication initiation ATPase DnaA
MKRRGPAAPPRQLPLDLPHRAAMSRADFLVGAGNAAALEVIDRWPLWPAAGVLLSGPAGSGKTHLVEIWRTMSGAARIPASELNAEAASSLPAGRAAAVAVEDLHAGPVDEAALFHLLNLAREGGAAVLMTSRVPAAGLPFRVPDLASRLRAAQPAALDAPDDPLLHRVLAKLFADRQVAVDAGVIDFMVLRMERSLEAAGLLVERLDREALAQGVSISRRLAGLVMAELFDHQPDFWPGETGREIEPP